MQYSHILWDFNGTLLDDVSIGIESINTLLVSRHLAPLDREAYYRAFRFPIREYYRAVGFDFSKDPFEVLAHEWITEYRRREKTAPLCPHARQALTYIRDRGIPQILFSATQRQMLLEQTEQLGIADLFTEILGCDDVYADGKTSVGLAWVNRVKPKSALLIGDTEHDVQTAREMGIDCVLVAGGHQPESSLAALGVPVLQDLSRLAPFLESKEREDI